MRQFFFKSILMLFAFSFPPMIWAVADSTSVAMLSSSTITGYAQGFTLGTGTISLNITTNDLTPYTLYFNTKNKVCPYGMYPSVIVGTDAAGSQADTTKGISAFEVTPASNMVVSSSITAWGDNGHQSYGYGYYKDYSFQIRGENPPFVFIVSYRVSCEN